jgi:mRNA interferase HigB
LQKLDNIAKCYITTCVRIISRKRLVAFWAKRPDARDPLEVWYSLMKKNEFQDFAGLKIAFGAVDRVKPLYVFDIGGNKYRLVAAVHFNRSIVYVRHILTHKEYDEEKWKK